jgi:hypothetical protein
VQRRLSLSTEALASTKKPRFRAGLFFGWKTSLKGASEFVSGPDYSASVDAQVCQYESAALNGIVKPLLRYDMNFATLGWREKLIDSEGKVPTKTSGRLLAQRNRLYRIELKRVPS